MVLEVLKQKKLSDRQSLSEIENFLLHNKSRFLKLNFFLSIWATKKLLIENNAGKPNCEITRATESLC